MFVAQELRKKSIGEYLLYMWQIEDLIRANQCDIEKIKASIITKYAVEEDKKEELVKWYGELNQMMHDENVMQKGHLQINKNVIIWLNELHQKLAASPQFPFYHAAYFKVLPFIVELRSKSGSSVVEVSEIETCFEALYGVVLLKMQQKEISKDTLKAIEAISHFIAMLSAFYLDDKEGKLKFEES